MRIAVTSAFVGVLVLLFLTWKSSRRLSPHRKWANLSFWMTLVAIVITELMVRISGGVQVSVLFVVHLVFAGTFLCTLATLRFWMTGLKQFQYHRIGGYTCFTMYAGTFVTGMVLLW